MTTTTTRSVTHGSFTVERTYDAPPARVFNAFADPAAKKKWFHGPEEWGEAESEVDFRVGGHETNRGGPKGGPMHSYHAVYLDIVPNVRIISAYEMHMDDTKISVSLATLDFQPRGAGTRLVITEHGAFLDGYDDASERERGTRELLESLDAALRGDPGLGCHPG